MDIDDDIEAARPKRPVNPYDGQATVVNIAGENRRFEISLIPGKRPLRYDLAPGESIEVDAGYAARLVPAEGRDPMSSIIEKLTGGDVVPASDPRAQTMLKNRRAQAAAAAKEPRKA